MWFGWEYEEMETDRLRQNECTVDMHHNQSSVYSWPSAFALHSFSCSTFSVVLHPHPISSPTELRDMCITALANLQHSSQKDSRGGSGTMFSLQRDVIPFLEQNWEALTTAARRSTQSWHTTVSPHCRLCSGIYFSYCRFFFLFFQSVMGHWSAFWCFSVLKRKPFHFIYSTL